MDGLLERRESFSRFNIGNTRLFVGLAAILVHCEGTLAFAFQGRTEIIAREGDASPDGVGTFAGFRHSVLSESGTVGFVAEFTGGDEGIVTNSGGFRNVLVRSGQMAPDGNGSLSSFRAPWIGSSGQVGYTGILTGTSGGTADNSGLFTSNGSATVQVVRAGQTAPDGNGAFSSFEPPPFSQVYSDFNEFGEAAFARTLVGTTGGTNDNLGIFRGNGTSLVQIARKGQIAPGSTLAFNGFGLTRINSMGQIAFSAGLAGGTTSGIYSSSGGSPTLTRIVQSGHVAPGGIVLQSFSRSELNNSGLVAFYGSTSSTFSGGDIGLYVGNGGALTQIARDGQAAPGGGSFLGIGRDRGLALNNNGQVAFNSGLEGTSGGGIFRGNGSELVQIARTGNPAPGGNGEYQNFLVSFGRADFALNDSGQVAFLASLDSTSGGALDDSGIFTSDGIDSFAVVRKGSSLAGSTIFGLSLREGGDYIDGQDTLNNMGQIAYTARLGDGREVVNLWTPNLRWRSSSGGNWDTSSSWTLGLKPAFVHDVSIDPATNMTIMGPTSPVTSLRNLNIGGGAGEAILALQADTVLNVRNRVLVRPTGTLRSSLGNSTIEGFVQNAAGTILVVDGSTLTIQGSLLQTGELTIGLVGTTASRTIVTGFYSGDGFSGGGDLEVRGDFQLDGEIRSTTYGGNLFLGPASETHIGMTGPAVGDFDQIIVSGNLNLSGDLNVFFEGAPFLADNQQFLIADVAGMLTGQFNGLREGGLVGTFSGQQLFITYAAGDGNDIALMTVPEPGSSLMLALFSGFVLFRRKRN